jgi:hypothetical protein
MTTTPKGARALSWLSARLTEWLPSDSTRMIWLSNWETFPNQLIPFMRLRLGCGESRPPIEAPGHLFELSTEEENAVLAGYLFFVMAFNWEAYIVAQKSKDYIYLGDEHFVFSSADSGKMGQVSNLMSDFELKIIKDIREAWA